MTPEGNTALPPEFPPDGGQVAETLAATNVVLDNCAALVAAFQAHFQEALAACSSHCHGTVADCQSCIHGYLETILSKAEAAGDKAIGRCLSVVDTMLGQAFACAANFCTPPCDIEVIVADLASGKVPLRGEFPCPMPEPHPIPPVIMPPAGGFGGHWECIGSPPHWVWQNDDGGPQPPPAGAPPPPGPCPPAAGPPGACPPCEPAPPACPPPVINIPPCPPSPPCPGLPPMPPPPAPEPIPPIVIPPSPGPPVPQILPPPDEIIIDVPPPTVIIIEPPAPGPPPEPVIPEGFVGTIMALLPKWNQCDACPSFGVSEANYDAETDEAILDDLLGFLGPGGQELLPSWLYQILSGTLLAPFWRQVRALVRAVMVESVSWGASLSFQSSGCQQVAAIPFYIMRALAGFLEAYLHIGLSDFTQKLDYAINMLCPTEIPSVAEADAMVMRGLISPELWACWVRANNVLEQPHRCYVQAIRPGLSPDQLLLAKRRGELNDTEYQSELQRVTAWTKPVQQIWEALQEYYPPMAQLIREMAGPVADPQVTADLDLDAGFDAAYTQARQAWAHWQGIDDGEMRNQWHLHWREPSIAEAIEMSRRLSPDNPNLPPGVKPVTPEDVRALALRQGMPPGWVDRVLAVNVRQLTRRDLMLLRKYSIVDRGFVVNQLRVLGYDDDRANLIADAIEAQLALPKEPLRPILTPAALARDYVDGIITDGELTSGIQLLGYTKADAASALQDASTAKTYKNRRRVAANIKKQFMWGLLDVGTATGLLVAAGMPTDLAIEFIRKEKEAKPSKGKVPGTAMLCKWYDQGLLSDSQYFDALVRQGWSKGDAANLVESCKITQEAKAAKGSKPPKPAKP